MNSKFHTITSKNIFKYYSTLIYGLQQIIADFVGDVLFGEVIDAKGNPVKLDTNFLVELKKNDRNLFQRFVEWVHSILKRLTTKGVVNKDIVKLEQKFKRLAEQARQQRVKGEGEKSQTGEADGQYSLAEDGVKDQIKNNATELNSMDVVATLDEQKIFTSKQDVAEWALSKFEKIGFKVNRNGFGEIILDKKRITKGLRYLKTNEERLALAVLPDVLSKGIEIDSHPKHKGRTYDTFTFAAPVMINGQRGNMAVVVRREQKNYYKVHRLLLPDGTQFLLDEKRDTAERAGGVDNNSGLSPTDNVSKPSISNSTEKVKQKQLKIILKNNPANSDYVTWIRSVDDIYTLQETLEMSDWAEYDEYNPDYSKQDALDAIEKGKILVYSSKPISQGIFVTPSRMEAESYSGDGKVYKKLVNIEDVAWIDPTQGQFAKIDKSDESTGQYSLPDLDAEYMKAVESGDMETVQRMVDEAAKKAGYTINAYHGTPDSRNLVYNKITGSIDVKGDFSIFDSSKSRADRVDGSAFFFTNNEKVAKFYSPEQGYKPKVYNSKLKIVNPLFVECNGANWNEIPFDKLAYSYPTPNGGVKTTNKVTTKDIAQYARENGYDGVVFENIIDGKADTSENIGTVYAVFSSNQIKSADPVTYDDKGKVIPLSERFKNDNNDIRYSLPDIDSSGHKLSAGQMEYFKDSKVKDGKGRLIPVYHGSKSAGFTEFTKSDEIGYFFARTIKTSRTYAGGSKAIYAPDKNSPEFSGAANYKVYLDIKKPYIIDGNGANWNQLEANGERVDISIKSQKWNNGSGIAKIQFKYNSKTYSQTVRTSEEFESFISKHTNPEMAKAFAYAMGQAVDKNGKGEFNAGFIWDFKNSVQGDTKNTRDIVRKAYNSHWNYDGVIFKNVVDSGDGSKIKADDLYVVFDSNQIKSVNNTNPTEDKDIRYSLPDVDNLVYSLPDLDSSGQKLSAGQMEYFSDSKVRYRKGNLLVLYHGTSDGGFTK